MNPRHITIIGGGITGLATAFYLQRAYAGVKHAPRYTLLERDTRLGGKIATHSEAGFLVEGGPDSFISQKPQGIQLCRDLGLSAELLGSDDARYKTRLLQDGRLLPYPAGFRLAVPTKLWPFLCSRLISPWGKLRMGCDLFLPRRREPGDESLTAFISRRLGREALEKIAGPIMSGIFVADPDRMSVQSTFPMFVELERKYGSLTRGILLARRHAHPHASGSIFTTLRGGLGQMVEALAGQLTGVVRPGCCVRAILRDGDRYRLRLTDPEAPDILTDELVLTVPAYEAATLLAPLLPNLAKRLLHIRYVSSATVSLGYPDAALADCPHGGGYGFVVPRREPSRILAFTWSSRKFAGRAPEGCQLVRVFVGGSRHEPLAALPDADLLELVREELARILRIRTAPAHSWIYRWPAGNAQYDVGHLDRVTELERTTRLLPRLHLAGSAYRGVGIPDCVQSALSTVEKLRQDR